MRRHVGIIPDMMLPKPPLPYPALLARDMAGPQVSRRQATREPGFDQPPPGREIPVTARQCPDAVQMVWQNHPCLDLEGPLRLGHRDRLAQTLDVVNKQVCAAILQRDGEEDAGSGRFWADVIRHGRISPDLG